MLHLRDVREAVASAGKSIRDAMKVALLACLLSGVAVLIAAAALARVRRIGDQVWASATSG